MTFRSRGQLARRGTHVSAMERDARRAAVDARRVNRKTAWLIAAGLYEAAAIGYIREGKMADATRMRARARHCADKAASRTGRPRSEPQPGRQPELHHPPMGYTSLTRRIFYRRRGTTIRVISFQPAQLTAETLEAKLERLEGGRWTRTGRWKKMRGSLGREGWREISYRQVHA